MKPTGSSPHAETALSRCRVLAREIDELLLAAAREETPGSGPRDYAIRVAQGLTRSLIDQLGETDPAVARAGARTTPVIDRRS